jgi:hypothetical protein
VNAAQEFLLREATRAAQDALARAQGENSAQAMVIVLHEALSAAATALRAIQLIEEKKS